MNRRVADEVPGRMSPGDSRAPAAGPLVDRRKSDRRQSDRRQPSLHLPTEIVALAGAHLCTSREQQIIQLLLQGLTNKEIARQLGIAEDTVKKHLQHVYNKFGVRRRTLIILGRAGGTKSRQAAARRTSFVE